MRKKLKDCILEHLSQNPGWHKKVSLFIFCDEWGYSPDTLSRVLRELAEEGKLKVEYYNGVRAKNLAKYAIGDWQQPKINYQIVEKEGKLVYII